MAKAKSPKKPAQPGIPEALADHLQRQQNQAMLIACLLASVTKSVDSFDGTGDCTLVMRHIGCLIDDLLEALDSVSISKAAGGGVMNMEEVARDAAPQNPLTENNHVGDTLHNCQQVVQFLREVIPAQLQADAPEIGADGVHWILRMVNDALAYAQDQLRAHGVQP